MFSVYRIVAFVSIFRCWCHTSTPHEAHCWPHPGY